MQRLVEHLSARESCNSQHSAHSFRVHSTLNVRQALYLFLTCHQYLELSRDIVDIALYVYTHW